MLHESPLSFDTHSTQPSSSDNHLPLTFATPSTPLATTPRPNSQPLKRLSSEEIASHQERGLCFICEEKYHRGHHCAFRVFLLIVADDDNPNPTPSNIIISDPPDTPSPDPSDPTNLYPAQISLNSLVDHVALETLCLMGHIVGHPFLLLVDGGSTHNFIQQQLVTQLGLPCCTTHPLRVMVGNGQYLECQTICEATPLTIQGISFTIDLFVLPISGANVVLGV